MSRRTSLPLSLLLLAVAALALGGCGSDSDSGSDTSGAKEESTQPTSTETTTEETTDEAGSEAGSASTGDIDFTKPKTQLKFGEKAVVPFEYLDKVGALGISVTSIVQGKAADLTPLELGDQVSGMTPYYVKITVTNESGTDFPRATVGTLRPILGDGERAQKVSVIGGKFAPCESESAPMDFATKGLSYETCVLAVAAGSAKVTGLEYGETAPDAIAGAPDYSDDPIVWQE